MRKSFQDKILAFRLLFILSNCMILISKGCYTQGVLFIRSSWLSLKSSRWISWLALENLDKFWSELVLTEASWLTSPEDVSYPFLPFLSPKLLPRYYLWGYHFKFFWSRILSAALSPRFTAKRWSQSPQLFWFKWRKLLPPCRQIERFLAVYFWDLTLSYCQASSV